MNSVPTMLAFVAAFVAALSMTGRVSAQVAFDVRAVSAADNGAAGEFPLGFTIVYGNGAGSQGVSMPTDGTIQLTSPIGATDIQGIVFLGNFYPTTAGNVICIHLLGGGCWCLCYQWRQPWGWPWLVRPRLFWYYNPCC